MQNTRPNSHSTRHDIDVLQIIAPPPILFLVSLLSSCGLNYIFPTKLSNKNHILVICGVMLFLLSATIALWSFITMQQAQTSANPYKKSAHLTTLGPFKYSRNPIYLAMTGLYLSISLPINSIWAYILFLPLLLVMYWGAILREEKYLMSRFGESYLIYKKAVPRWLLIK